MKSNRPGLILLILILALLAACGGGGGISDSGSSGSPSGEVISSPPLSGGNVLPISVARASLNRSLLNFPSVTVTICTPGTRNCQSIPDILLDTASFGLRIFRQALSVPLEPVPRGSGLLGECARFAGGTFSTWGPVERAIVFLGGEPGIEVSVQVIDPSFGTVPGSCENPLLTPSQHGYNGILGVGLLIQDCGPPCVGFSRNEIYFSCNGLACTGAAADLASQVQNPVALLPQDNNGVIVQLPVIPPGGAASVRGNLVLGIGTQSNNSPGAVTAYPANEVAEFETEFNGTVYPSFIDSGSNGIFFPAPASLPDCPEPNSEWFCPPSLVTFSAINSGAFGSPTGDVSFQIGNLNDLVRSGNLVFNDIGGDSPAEFDWGLPFFFGRNVIVGFEGRSSSLGTGPYWAY